MSLLWTESFVGWSTPVGLYNSPVGPQLVVVGAGPNGQNIYKPGNNTNTLPKTLPGMPAVVGVGFRAKINGMGAKLCSLRDTGNEQLTMLTDSVGRLIIMTPGSVIVGTTAPGAVVANISYYFTLDAKIDPAAGYLVVKVNGITVINVAGVNTRGTANSYVTDVYLTGDVDFCDWYITDGVVSGAEPVATIGDVRIVALRPSGAGSNAQFAPSAGANWQNVDDAPSTDADATYNASANPTDLDSFVTPGLGAVVATTIPAVFVKSYARKDDAGVRTLAGFVKLGANTEAAAGTPLSAGYAWQADKFPLDPAGNPWTKANVNAAEFGYDLIA